MVNRPDVNYPKFKDQFAVMDFEAEPMPVLSLYPMPAPLELCDWELKLTDTTGNTTVIRWEDLQRLPKVQEPTPLVCQIFNWSETPEVTGVRLNTVLEAAGLNASSAGYLAFYSADGMPHELFNAAPYGEEFTQIFLGNREYTDLPRKLNVTITGCLENCTHSETQDIAMTPAIGPKGVYGFNVAVGGQLYDELAKSMLMMVIEDRQVEEAVQIIQAAASTGFPGDGRTFVSDVDAAYTLRTGQSGL